MAVIVRTAKNVINTPPRYHLSTPPALPGRRFIETVYGLASVIRSDKRYNNYNIVTYTRAECIGNGAEAVFTTRRL